MIYDVDFYRDHPAVENIRLEEIGGRTRFTNTIVYEALEFRDGHVASGMEWGMNETFVRLDELLADIARDPQPANTKDLVLDRVFDAPRDLVFRAWTDPKMVARWWGPHHFDAPLVEFDVRAGGAIRIDMRAPDGTVLPMGGFFREVTPPSKLVFTARAMEDADGNAQPETLNTVTFTAYGNKTGVHLHVQGTHAAPGAQQALAGMAEGWTQTLDKLAGFVKAA